MTDNGFSRKGLEREVAQGNLNVEAKARGKFSKENLKQLIDYQHKTNVIQCIIAVVLILLGIIINIVKKNGMGIIIGSIIQEDTTISNITVNLGVLLILGGVVILINVAKESNTNFKEK